MQSRARHQPIGEDRAARDELIVANRHLIRPIARRLHFSIGKNVALEDLVAYGDKGLSKRPPGSIEPEGFLSAHLLSVVSKDRS
jgi:hypothetical protein